MRPNDPDRLRRLPEDAALSAFRKWVSESENDGRGDIILPVDTARLILDAVDR